MVDTRSGSGSWTQLWGIGTQDGAEVTPMQGSSEFGYTNNVWEAGINFDVDTDALADFPAALSNETQQSSNQPGAVDIDFNLAQAHARGELLFTYARYGSEVDVVMVDDTLHSRVTPEQLAELLSS